MELPNNVKEYIHQNKKNYIRDEEKWNLVSKIEDVYQSWINTLIEEIEDMDKGNHLQMMLDKDLNYKDGNSEFNAWLK